MKTERTDVVVVGAGIAGLAAAATVKASGADVVVLEARERVGGRIVTRPGEPPLEAGAEFLPRNGRAVAELESAGAAVAPVPGGHARLIDGTLTPFRLEHAIQPALVALSESADGERPDRSLERALAEATVGADAASSLRRYVEQYHAAPADAVSTRWVAAVESTDEGEGGGPQVRVADGLYQLAQLYLDQLGSALRTGHRAWLVDGRSSHGGHGAPVRVSAWSPSGPRAIDAAAAIVALPVPLLRVRRPALLPLPDCAATALDGLRMGRAVKLVLRFRRPFWHGGDDGDWAATTFLHTDGPFPTWWTRRSEPTLVAWAGGSAADRVARGHKGRQARPALVSLALSQLADMLGWRRTAVEAELQEPLWHDWTADLFARGAYPYAVPDGADAADRLARPIADRIMLAGDAITDATGTVDGALHSGLRAARQALERLE